MGLTSLAARGSSPVEAGVGPQKMQKKKLRPAFRAADQPQRLIDLLVGSVTVPDLIGAKSPSELERLRKIAVRHQTVHLIPGSGQQFR